MTLQVASLGSGSKGNCTLVRCGDTCLLVDCGFTIKETVRRLGELNISPENISAILVTHEHGDHLSGVGPLARKFNLPVWMTFGTRRMAKDLKKLAELNLFHANSELKIGDARVIPFTVPHDAAEPCQFIFESNNRRLALLTDLGKTTNHVSEQLQNCDAILLECNYDAQMMRDGPYPPALQARITSNYGHLDNQQAADILSDMQCGQLQHIMLSHLSEQNNHPDKAMATIKESLPASLHNRLSVSNQHQCGSWLSVI